MTDLGLATCQNLKKRKKVERKEEFSESQRNQTLSWINLNEDFFFWQVIESSGIEII